MHHQIDGTLYVPNDLDFVNPREKLKGQRYCYVAAIHGPSPDPNCWYVMTNVGLSSFVGIIHGSVEIFVAQISAGDYHGNFKSEICLKWSNEMLCLHLHVVYQANVGQVLDDRRTSFHHAVPHQINMDNAKYHKAKQDGTPAIKDFKMKDGSAVAYMRANDFNLPLLRPGQRLYYRNGYIEVMREYFANVVPL